MILQRWLRPDACSVRAHALRWSGFDLATISSEVCLDTMSRDATLLEPPDELC